jgi:hypothetical protein
VAQKYWNLRGIANIYNWTIYADSICVFMLCVYMLTMLHFSKSLTLFVQNADRSKSIVMLATFVSFFYLVGVTVIGTTIFGGTSSSFNYPMAAMFSIIEKIMDFEPHSLVYQVGLQGYLVVALFLYMLFCYFISQLVIPGLMIAGVLSVYRQTHLQ